MKSVILAVMLSVALASVVVLAGMDQPRPERNTRDTDAGMWLVLRR